VWPRGVEARHVLSHHAPQVALAEDEDVAYFNRERPHQALTQATPEPQRNPARPCTGLVRAVPVLGGLHDAYRRAA
jgi:hypothetical protein